MRSNHIKLIITVIIIVIFTIFAFSIIRIVLSPEPVKEIEKIESIEPRQEIIGVSTENRKIESYTYGNGKKKLVFVGGIHGGYEWNSVLLAYQFIDYLNLNKEIIPADLTVTIIPNANPDGVYTVTGKEGRFTIADVSTDSKVLAEGRFNANNIDLNRNFDCKWQEKSTWQNKTSSLSIATL